MREIENNQAIKSNIFEESTRETGKTEHVLIISTTFCLFQRISSRENEEYLKNGGAGRNVRE